MHIEYWICDGCNQEIERDEQLKYVTPEMGYPYIPKGGGGKHFHKLCLLDFYRGKKNLTQEQISELMEDAEQRHSTHISQTIRKGKLTKEKFKIRKTTKADRDNLFNYFHYHYGMQAPTGNINRLVDKLNAGEDYGNYKGIKIPYFKLKNMLVFYRKDLDKTYSEKQKKEGFINPIARITYDIAIIVNNLADYTNKTEAIYKYMSENKIEGEQSVQDYSGMMEGVNKRRVKEAQEEFERLEMLKQFAEDELGKIN